MRTKASQAEQRAADEVTSAIAKLLKDAGITQRELSRRLRVSQPMVTQWLNPGCNPGVRTLARIAAACGKRVVIAFE